MTKSKKTRRDSGRDIIDLSHEDNDVRYDYVWNDWNDYRDGFRDWNKLSEKRKNKIKKQKILRRKKQNSPRHRARLKT